MSRFAKFTLLIIIILTTVSSAQAGLLVRKKQAGSEKSNPISAIDAVRIISDNNDQLSESQPNIDERNYNRPPKRKPSESGWEGIAALCCAFFFPPLGIIFGALGMGKGHKHQGLAIAGFVVGCVYTFFMVMLITILLLAYS